MKFPLGEFTNIDSKVILPYFERESDAYCTKMLELAKIEKKRHMELQKLIDFIPINIKNLKHIPVQLKENNGKINFNLYLSTERTLKIK